MYDIFQILPVRCCLHEAVSKEFTRSAGSISKLNFDDVTGCTSAQQADDCIVVDEQDAVIDSASKRSCHLLDNINAGDITVCFLACKISVIYTYAVIFVLMIS